MEDDNTCEPDAETPDEYDGSDGCHPLSVSDRKDTTESRVRSVLKSWNVPWSVR